MANIVHASIDERGKINRGSAGDQTGREVCVRTWYNKPWNCVLRYKDYNIACKAADIAIKLANSNLVGYDQYQRNTLYQELKKNNWNVDAYIKSGVKTETDCSAFIYACYCCLLPELRSDSNAPITSTIPALFEKHGFIKNPSGVSVSSDKNALKGDIYDNTSHHIVMMANNGANASIPSSNTTPTITGNVYVKVNTKSDPLNCRKTPSSRGALVGKFAKGTILALLEKTSSSWWKVTGKSTTGKTITGYCSASYLVATTARPKTEFAIVNTKSNPLNCRKTPSLRGALVGKFAKGTKVSIDLKESATWWKVTGKSTTGKTITGYCSAKYLK